MAYLTCIMQLKIKGLGFTCCLCFSSKSIQNMFHYTGKIGIKVFVQAIADISIFNELYRQMSAAMKLLSIPREEALVLSIAWFVWVSLWGPLANNSIQSIPVLVLKISLVITDCNLELCLPHYLTISFYSQLHICIYLAISFRWFSHMYILQEGSTIFGFQSTPQIPINFSYLYLYFILELPLHSPCTLDSSIAVSHICITVFFQFLSIKFVSYSPILHSVFCVLQTVALLSLILQITSTYKYTESNEKPQQICHRIREETGRQDLKGRIKEESKL